MSTILRPLATTIRFAACLFLWQPDSSIRLRGRVVFTPSVGLAQRHRGDLIISETIFGWQLGEMAMRDWFRLEAWEVPTENRI